MIPSPCCNICKMDATSGLCLGCWRSLDEITVWSRTDDIQRARILAKVAQRRETDALKSGALPDKVKG